MVWGLKFDIFVIIFYLSCYGGTKGFIESCVVDFPLYLRRVRMSRGIKRFFRTKRDMIPLITYIQCIGVLALLPCILALYLVSLVFVLFFDPQIGRIIGPIAVILLCCLSGLFVLPNSFAWIYYYSKMERKDRQIKRQIRRYEKKAGIYKKKPSLVDEIKEMIHSTADNKRRSSFIEAEKELKKFYVYSKRPQKNKYYVTLKNSQKVEELISNKYPHANVRFVDENGERVMLVCGEYTDNSTRIILKAVVNKR